jgi:hypothetical protein
MLKTEITADEYLFLTAQRTYPILINPR